MENNRYEPKDLTIARDATMLRPETIPEEGYELGGNETVILDNIFDGRTADGHIYTDNKSVIPYMNIADMRVGGVNKFTDYRIIATPANGSYTNYKDGQLLMFAKTPGLQSSRPMEVSNIPNNGVIGRNNPWFRDLPNTVSREHVMVLSDRSDHLCIQNLEPSNYTTIYKTYRVRRAPVDDPLEMAATMAIDPETGEIVAGPTVNAKNPWQVLDRGTGAVLYEISKPDNFEIPDNRIALSALQTRQRSDQERKRQRDAQDRQQVMYMRR